MSYFKTENLCVRYLYGNFAVNNVSLELENKSRLVILGGEGSGKTSLLKAIAGITPIESGKIFLKSADITLCKSKNRNIMMLYEDLGLVPRLSLYKNFDKILKLRSVSKVNREYIIKGLSVKYRVDAFLRDKASSLSTNNIIRSAFLRTELRDADLILIDNIFNQAGDRRRELFEDMLPVIYGMETPLIYATSSFDEAISLDCPILFLHYGKAMQFGEYFKLKRQPQYLEVDKFFNTKNYELVDIKNAKLDLYGNVLDIPIEDYESDKVHITFRTKLKDGGFNTTFCSKFFKKGQFFLCSCADGKKYLTEVSKEQYEKYSKLGEKAELEVDLKSVRMYHYNTEKAFKYQ